MIAFLVTAIFSAAIYLLLSAGSGTLLFWSGPELVAAALIGILCGAVCRNIFCATKTWRMANPVRWLVIVLYVLVPFFAEMARANLDVAYRVITGRIRPGIVRISTGLQTDLGTMMLANSITLTPGTLTVDVDEGTGDLYVHMINIPRGLERREKLEAKEIFTVADLSSWIRRIAK